MKFDQIIIRRYSTSRLPISVEGVKELLKIGTHIFIEECDNSESYKSLGCRVVPCNFWQDSTIKTLVVSIDEPALAPFPLIHHYLFFSSILDSNLGSTNISDRLFWGNGILYDLSLLLKGQKANFITDNTPRVLNASFERNLLPILTNLLSNDDVSNELENAKNTFLNIIANHTPTA